jgi:hypothetical protein
VTQADLSVIPDFETRIRADTDFRIAQECQAEARRILQHRGPAWRFSHRLELRRAMRFWKHYANAVRAAQ